MFNSARSSKAGFLILLTFGLAVVFAQTVNLKHDIEHQYHGAQESCSIYLAFNPGFNSDLSTVEVDETVSHHLLVSSYSSVISSKRKAAFAIRAPPASLQS